MGPITSIELWGTNTGCGAALEQLPQAPAQEGIMCVKLQPNQDYDLIFVVFRGGAAALLTAGLLAFAPVIGCGKKTEPGNSGPSTSAGQLVAAASAAEGSAPCSKVCVVAQALHCPAAASCAKTCAEMRSDSACPGEVARVLECMAREPPEHWECDADGQAAIRDGYCDAEQSAAIKCASGASK